jgi:hypothetical protein
MDTLVSTSYSHCHVDAEENLGEVEIRGAFTAKAVHYCTIGDKVGIHILCAGHSIADANSVTRVFARLLRRLPSEWRTIKPSRLGNVSTSCFTSFVLVG